MCVKVDQPRGDDGTGHVEPVARLQARSDSGHFARGESDIQNGIRSGHRIDHAPAEQYKIISQRRLLLSLWATV